MASFLYNSLSFSVGHLEGLTGQYLELPGAISEGKTLDELKANMKEAIELVLEEMKKSKTGTIVIEIQVGSL